MNLRDLFRRRKPEPAIGDLVDVLLTENAAARTNARAIREAGEIDRELVEHPEYTALTRRLLLRGITR